MKRLTLFCFTMWSCAQAQGGFNVGLGWDESPEPDVTGYNLYYGGSIPDVRQNCIHVGKANRCIVPALSLGQPYFFTVTAVNEAGMESEPSNVVALPVWPALAMQSPIKEMPMMIYSQIEVNKVFIVEFSDSVNGPWNYLGESSQTPGLASVRDEGVEKPAVRFYRARLAEK